MKKFFNTAGPNVPRLHYTVWREDGVNPILELIEQEKYFTHHAPRQSGKTTLLEGICRRLNQEGKYLAISITVESAQAARDNVIEANRSILRSLNSGLTACEDYPSLSPCSDFFGELDGVRFCLETWSKESKKPIVLIIDEIDSMAGESLIALLRQLRAGYGQRPHAFPQSIILNGVRDLKDYRIYSSKEDTWLTGGSCFNIKAKSIRLGNFTLENVRELFSQHEAEHNQKLAPGLVEKIYELTQGQPWLCNALGEQMCFELFPEVLVLDETHLHEAKEALILSRATHIDQLYYRLEDPRIRQIVIPMLAGEDVSRFPQEDLEYARDLGLLHPDTKVVRIANPLYKEILPREMTYALQQGMAFEPHWYELPNGKLNYKKLMDEFVGFWREHGQVEFYALEITPHTMFMAWLQRLVNGGGAIHREYALGRKRLDILVTFAGEKFVSEIKLYRGEKTLSDGLNQICEYLDQIGLSEGYLMIFQKNLATDEDSRYRVEAMEYLGKKVLVYWL
ncbi:MAG: AAA-like domain-containing protein [Candidatus Cloacimonetes bacterium]|nr:AAA-like domain-containing protein [Candidatus Cloacimonadota bacterium]